MKRLLAVSSSLIMLLFFVAVGSFLIGLLQNQSSPNTAQEFGAASTPTAPSSLVPAQTPSLSWETATLKQIHFGEPKVVFTHNDHIRIYDWLPDNRRLLLEIGDPTKTAVGDLPERYRIVTLDVETGEIVEYGRRPSRDVRPVWVEAVQGVAYDFYDHWHNKLPEIRLGLGEKQIHIIVQSNAYLEVDPRTDNLLYLERGKSENALYAMDTKQNKIVSVLSAQDLPGGQLRVDPTGRRLASFPGRLSKKPLYLADRDRGTVTKVDFAPWWPIDAAWSPDGDKIALVLGTGDMLLSKSQLAILEIETMKWHFVDLPAQFVTGIEWAPKRYLLAKGTPAGFTEMSDFHKFWLVDTTNGDFRETDYFTPTMVTENIFWSWSDKGDIAWLDGDQVIVTHITVKEGQ